MGPVDGIAALESHHILAMGQGGAHLGRGAAGEVPLGQGQPLDAPAQVITAPFAGDHAHGRVFEGGGAVTAHGLLDLVGFPAALHRQHRQVLAPIGEQQALADGDAGVIGVKDDRQAKQQATAGAVVRHHRFVVLLVHEAPQGRKTADDQQFDVAGIAITAGDDSINGASDGLALVGRHHQIHQGAAMGANQAGVGTCWSKGHGGKGRARGPLRR